MLNRFPFMAAPAHLIQLIAQQGGGVAIPGRQHQLGRAVPARARPGAADGRARAGRPAARADRAGRDRAQRGRRPAARPRRRHALPRRLAAAAGAAAARWRASGTRASIELYGSTETMLLGTSCARGTLHLETDAGLLRGRSTGDRRAGRAGSDGRLVVTTLGIEGSPLVRLDTGDVVRRRPPCPCGDPRPAIIVLGRAAEVVELAGRRRCIRTSCIDAAAAAADALDSQRLLRGRAARPLAACASRPTGARAIRRSRSRDRLAGVPVEVERVAPGMLLDVELLGRSPHVYKPVVLSDWRGPGRRILTRGRGHDRVAAADVAARDGAGSAATRRGRRARRRRLGRAFAVAARARR